VLAKIANKINVNMMDAFLIELNLCTGYAHQRSSSRLMHFYSFTAKEIEKFSVSGC